MSLPLRTSKKKSRYPLPPIFAYASGQSLRNFSPLRKEGWGQRKTFGHDMPPLASQSAGKSKNG